MRPLRTVDGVPAESRPLAFARGRRRDDVLDKLHETQLRVQFAPWTGSRPRPAHSHSLAGGAGMTIAVHWVPACAGMTFVVVRAAIRKRHPVQAPSWGEAPMARDPVTRPLRTVS